MTYGFLQRCCGCGEIRFAVGSRQVRRYSKLITQSFCAQCQPKLPASIQPDAATDHKTQAIAPGGTHAP